MSKNRAPGAFGITSSTYLIAALSKTRKYIENELRTINDTQNSYTIDEFLEQLLGRFEIYIKNLTSEGKTSSNFTIEYFTELKKAILQQAQQYRGHQGNTLTVQGTLIQIAEGLEKLIKSR